MLVETLGLQYYYHYSANAPVNYKFHALHGVSEGEVDVVMMKTGICSVMTP